MRCFERVAVRRVLPALVLLLAGPVFVVPAAAGERQPIAGEPVGLEALAFIAGRWLGQEGDTLIEEVWTAPAGDAMVGMFRMVQAGQARFYEFQSISLEDGVPVLRIKHFSAALVGWEEKADSLRFTLDQVRDGVAVFDEVDAEVPTTLRFERTKDDRLVIILRKIRDGEAHDSRFEFQRQPL